MSAIELSEEQILRRHEEIGTEQERARTLLATIREGRVQIEPVKPEFIAHEIARQYRVTVPALMGNDRHRYIARVRRVLMAALRATGMSYPEIGRFVGGRDHTTIIAGVRKFYEETKGTGP